MLEQAGLDERLVEKAVEPKNRAIGDKVVRIIRDHGFKPTASQKLARKIMGRNMFGVEDAIKYFGLNPTRHQIAVLAEVPFSPALLRLKRHTHVLVAKFPLSILDVRGVVDDKFFHYQNWFNDHLFAQERGSVSWELVKKTPKNKSFSSGWLEQVEMINEGDKVPSANLMVYTIIGFWRATGRKLFKASYVRTSTKCFSGKRVYIGYTQEGLRIHYGWESSHKPYIGVAVSRKSFF